MASVAMVACGAGFANELPSAASVAMIVVGAGMFFVGMLLPTLTEFKIGPGGFWAKLRERDEDVESTLGPQSAVLLQLAAQLAGDPRGGEELLERALVETYMRWSEAKREGPADAVRGQLRDLASTAPQASAAAHEEPR